MRNAMRFAPNELNRDFAAALNLEPYRSIVDQSSPKLQLKTCDERLTAGSAPKTLARLPMTWPRVLALA